MCTAGKGSSMVVVHCQCKAIARTGHVTMEEVLTNTSVLNFSKLLTTVWSLQEKYCRYTDLVHKVSNAHHDPEAAPVVMSVYHVLLKKSSLNHHRTVCHLINFTSWAGRSLLCRSWQMGCWRKSFAWHLCNSRQQTLVTVPSKLLLPDQRLRTEQPCCSSAG